METAAGKLDSALEKTPPDELDAAIRETSDYLNRQLTRGSWRSQ
jgi:hypothetical protein